MDTVTLQAEPRTVIGKQVRQLRRQGLVPANLYGAGSASVPIQLAERMVTHRLLRSSRSSLFSLEVDGSETQTVLAKEIQRHPTSGQVLHVDFFRVRMTEKLRTSVALQFVGEAPAVRTFSGTLLTSLAAVEVESLPGDLPGSIEVDVSGLDTLDEGITVRDLSIPAGVTVLTPPDELVARVLPPRVEAEAAEEAAQPEAEAGAAAETQQPAAATEAAEAEA